MIVSLFILLSSFLSFPSFLSYSPFSTTLLPSFLLLLLLPLPLLNCTCFYPPKSSKGTALGIYAFSFKKNVRKSLFKDKRFKSLFFFSL